MNMRMPTTYYHGFTIFFQLPVSRTMACQDLTAMSPTEVKSFFDSYDTVLTDCDGVLWKGNPLNNQLTN